jgi:hypothetical protein
VRKSLLLVVIVSALPLTFLGACSDDPTIDPADSGTAPTSTTTTTTTTSTTTTEPPSDASPDRSVAPDLKAKIEAYDTALAKAVCAKVTTCCSNADLDLYTAQFKEAPYKVTTPITAQNCEAVLKQAFDALNVQKWGVSASVGNIVFEEAKGTACVAKISAATCGTPLTTALFDGPCFGIRGNEVFRKVGALGAACDDIGDTTFIGECDPALGYCNEQKKCTAWRKTGESCGILLQDAGPTQRLFCAPGTNCDGQSPRNPGKCSVAPRNVGLGETCSTLSGPDLVCPTTAYCDVLGTRSCEPKRANGEVCQGDDECTDARPFSCFRTSADAGVADAGAAPRACGSTAFCGGR